MGHAKTLDDAYSYLNPLLELKKDKPYWKWFYIERSNNTLNTLIRAIRKNLDHHCFLYSGHTGCGKSTELERLANTPILNKEFLIIHYSIKEELDPANIDFADILISIAAKLFIKATEQELNFSDISLREIKEWKEAVIEHSDTFLGTMELKVQADIKAFFLQFLGVLKGAKEQKESYTVKLKPRINQLIDIINKRLVLEMGATLNKQALVIIDDLEKVSLEQAKSLFYDHGHLLASLQCNVIYTFPIALEYDLDMNSIIRLFGDVIRLPNIKIKDRTNQPVNENIELMKQMVLKRIEENLIELKALEKSIEYSGGVLRELFRILFSACNHALNRDMGKITEEHVNSAITNIKNHYIFSLTEEHYPFLSKVYHSKEVGGEYPYVRLMHSLHVLKYANDHDWFDINPMIKERVEQKIRKQPEDVKF